MGPRVTLLLLGLVLAAAVIEAQRDRPERRGRPGRGERPERRGSGGRQRPDGRPRGENRGSGKPGGRRWTGDLYSWTRDLGNGNTALERAYVPTGRQVLFQRSSGPALRTLGFIKAVTLYDFSSDTPMMMISLRGPRRKGPCIMTTPSFASFQEVIDLVSGRNGTTVAVTNQVSIDGTAEVMSDNDVQELFRSKASARRICRRGLVTRAAPAGSNPNPNVGDTEDVKVLTLDSELTIRLPVLEAGGRGGRGGRRGGRGRGEGGQGRGEGGHGRRRQERRHRQDASMPEA